MRLLHFLGHLLIAVVGSFLVYLPFYVVLSTLLKEPLLPAVLLAGAVVGYFMNRKEKDRSAYFIWVVPLIFVGYEILDNSRSFSQSWAHQSFPRFIWDNFFGQECGGSECLDELFFTAPLFAATGYSVAAYFAPRFSRKEARSVSRVSRNSW